MLTYLVDANNVIHRHPALREQAKKDIKGAGERLVALVTRIAGRGKKIVLVFDGTVDRRLNISPSLQLVVSESGADADLTIKRLIDESKNPRNLVIVSNDMEVAGYGRLHACHIMPADEFIISIARTEHISGGEKPSSMSGVEKEEWLKLFGQRRGNDAKQGS